ncbi:OsmC family protein [Aeromicrobium wangtongii]|uniref:OsmC family protein n=1 Tax=Aeromicrobium wangtongii TaxID=2969247 RepID=A0ABY5M9H6_9ACTN|nr:OsmC family protein [Aeromicrobium wangtongii]MCD9199284.1 OsmC family protein [Aeromicrobium wangtongii]UUP13645.1 OsmC family protein [Aeromicrobium wangtongii]
MSGDTERTVQLTRTGPSRYRATNARGTTLDIGDGSSDDFTPVELLLVALAGCTAITVDPLVSRRAEPDVLDVDIRADKIRDELGNHLVDLLMRFDVAFPGGEAGDRARELLPDALAKAEERLCTVSRTLAIGAQAEIEINDVQPR